MAVLVVLLYPSSNSTTWEHVWQRSQHARGQLIAQQPKEPVPAEPEVDRVPIRSDTVEPLQGSTNLRLDAMHSPPLVPTMLTFLHTSDVHVATFGALVERAGPEVPVHHEVHAELLDAAQGQSDPAGLLASVHDTIEAMANAGSRLVVCTCSSIAAAAELAQVGDCRTLRIDRPAAELAASSGRRIVVVAALATALSQTVALLQHVSSSMALEPEVVQHHCPNVWRLFQSGQHQAYAQAVATEIERVATDGDLILLGQASMAPAAQFVRTQGVDVVNTPATGVQAAVRLYRRSSS